MRALISGSLTSTYLMMETRQGEFSHSFYQKKKLLFLNSKDFDQDSGEIYQCNICDTEACNSWGTDAMPDPRADNSAFMSEPELIHLLSFTALLLARL